MHMTSLSSDYHVSSTFSDGTASLRDNIERAELLRLQVLGCVETVRSDSAWVSDFIRLVHDAQRHTSVQLLCGVETKMLDAAGALDLPDDLRGIDRVYIADHRFPVAAGIYAPWKVRRAIQQGWLTTEMALRSLVFALTRAIDRCDRPAVISHPFSILPKVGLSDTLVDQRLIEPLIDVCLRRNTAIELDERWQCPSLHIAMMFHDAGVPIVMSTSAQRPHEIGRFTWARDVLQQLMVSAA